MMRGKLDARRGTGNRQCSWLAHSDCVQFALRKIKSGIATSVNIVGMSDSRLVKSQILSLNRSGGLSGQATSRGGQERRIGAETNGDTPSLGKVVVDVSAYGLMELAPPNNH
jgi:hypothetical protein